MKTVKSFAIVSALIVLFSACSKEVKEDLGAGVEITVTECRVLSDGFAVTFETTVPEGKYESCYLLAIATSDTEAIKNVKKWKDLKSTKGMFSSQAPAESGEWTLSIPYLEKATDYMVIVALVDSAGERILKLSEPEFSKTVAAE